MSGRSPNFVAGVDGHQAECGWARFRVPRRGEGGEWHAQRRRLDSHSPAQTTGEDRLQDGRAPTRVSARSDSARMHSETHAIHARRQPGTRGYEGGEGGEGRPRPGTNGQQ